MNNFTEAYITAALWSSTDNSDDQGGDPLDKNYSILDIAPDTLAQMIADCEQFQRLHSELLEIASDEQNGHDFWLTRNGHGAGFWDRGYGEPGKRLTEASHRFGEFDLYIGDDGKIHGC